MAVNLGSIDQDASSLRMKKAKKMTMYANMYINPTACRGLWMENDIVSIAFVFRGSRGLGRGEPGNRCVWLFHFFLRVISILALIDLYPPELKTNNGCNPSKDRPIHCCGIGLLKSAASLFSQTDGRKLTSIVTIGIRSKIQQHKWHRIRQSRREKTSTMKNDGGEFSISIIRS